MIPKQQLPHLTQAILYPPPPPPKKSRARACSTGNFQDVGQTPTRYWPCLFFILFLYPTLLSVQSSCELSPLGVRLCCTYLTLLKVVKAGKKQERNGSRSCSPWWDVFQSITIKITGQEGDLSLSLSTHIHGKIHPLLVWPEGRT